MKKLKIFLQFEKEERWLERMASQGWLLCGKSFFYCFREALPDTKTIRIDYRAFRGAKDFSDYCTLFEDSGWKHIAGTKSSGTQYFLKTNEGSTEDIFSDTLSRAGRYHRLANMWLYSAIPFLPLLLSMKTGGWIDLNGISSPKEWYLTPGLWDLEGLPFWWAFLFETPFALMRGIGWLIPIIAILICSVFFIKSRLLYRSEFQNKGPDA